MGEAAGYTNIYIYICWPPFPSNSIQCGHIADAACKSMSCRIFGSCGNAATVETLKTSLYTSDGEVTSPIRDIVSTSEEHIIAMRNFFCKLDRDILSDIW